ncbi:MAG: alpha/beta hydrolase [Planctomycetia bacterium]|nr:alpha/beta hydrolase [Planctomycetia bacterium]
MKHRLSILVSCCALLAASQPASFVRADDEVYTRTEDVIYRRKHGTALTLDVFAPKENANGAAIVLVVSGAWRSSRDSIRPVFASEYVKRGYTVFTVVHGSSPRFSLPEIVEDMHRAVRFVRSRAVHYRFDADRIGVTGASAGGHLSLLLGTAGAAGDPNAADPVDRLSSRVQAVACFFPPTDLLNYGLPGLTLLGGDISKGVRAPFDFQELDESVRSFVMIADRDRRLEIGKQMSPVYHVSADDPPTMIIHGDADLTVPLQQSKLIIDKFKEASVPCELIVKPGKAHGWSEMGPDVATLADWFDKYLAKKSTTP